MECPGNVETSYSRPPIVSGIPVAPNFPQLGWGLGALEDHTDPPSSEDKLLLWGQEARVESERGCLVPGSSPRC